MDGQLGRVEFVALPEHNDREHTPAAQAAAILAALEQFLRDTAPPPPRAPRGGSTWLRSARAEALRDELPSHLSWPETVVAGERPTGLKLLKGTCLSVVSSP
jgi:hypothetical protein